MASSRQAPGEERPVATALARAGVAYEWRALAQPTRTAPEAAAALGVPVEAIVKSVVFMAGEEPVLVLVAGHHRADLGRLTQVLGRPVRAARTAEVEQATGYAPGVVPPCGHRRALATLCDRALLGQAQVWAAGGAPRELFGVRPEELVRATGAQVVELGEEPPGT